MQTNKDPQRQHQLEESFAMFVANTHDVLNEDDEEPVVKLILRFESHLCSVINLNTIFNEFSF